MNKEGEEETEMNKKNKNHTLNQKGLSVDVFFSLCFLVPVLFTCPEAKEVLGIKLALMYAAKKERGRKMKKNKGG